MNEYVGRINNTDALEAFALDAEAQPLPSPEQSSPAIVELNASDAGNLSFIVSHRIARNQAWRLMLDREENEAAMAELAEKVARRLEELSLRLADDRARAELGGER